MSLSFSVQLSKTALKAIEKRVAASLSSEPVKHAISAQILRTPAVARWVNFLGSRDFVAEFGVPPSIAARMKAGFVQEVTTIRVRRSKGSVIFSSIDQDNLRSITSWAWGSLLVNAWDAYEYGIIGGRRAPGITGSHIDKTLTSIERRYSRTGFALMKPGGTFLLATGAAPRAFSVRSSFVKSAEIFAQRIKDKVKL